MKPSGILIFYHCGSNTGYAIGRHEPDFLEMARILTGDINNVHLGYISLDEGKPRFVDENFTNVIRLDPRDSSRKSIEAIDNYIRNNNIDVAFGFDQPVSRPAYSVMRKAGIKLLVSYWGAPMSSINHGVKLFLKKLEVRMLRNKPDHFIFQSKAMADTAVFGRGIEPCRTTVIYNAVDTEVFKPDPVSNKYTHKAFNIPEDRKIVIFSGHMEERKGVHVIVEAANELVLNRNRRDVHFLFLGNINGQEKKFAPRYSETETENHITFGGYRNDINLILPSCYVGAIASTGWDSFTMSAMEMASTGLPLIVSNLQGLVETIDNNKSGYLIEPGDHIGLADKLELLLANPALQKDMGSAGRRRVLDKFSREKHIETLVASMQKLYSSVIN